MSPTWILPLALVLLGVGAWACGEAEPPPPDLSLLERPNDPAFSGQAPDRFRASFETTKGRFVVEVERAWAPRGADRFHSLVRNGYYDGVSFFRVIEGFMAQFGLHGSPFVALAWAKQPIEDDLPARSNLRGTMSFAMSGPNSRTTQVFINFADNTELDGQGFAPVGQVVEGMDVVDRIYAGYGETVPQGRGPAPRFIIQGGTEWLQREYPQLDYVRWAAIVEDEGT